MVITLRALAWGKERDLVKAEGFDSNVPVLYGWIARPRYAINGITPNWGGSYAALMASADLRVQAEQAYLEGLRNYIPEGYQGPIYEDLEYEHPNSTRAEQRAAATWDGHLQEILAKTRPGCVPWRENKWRAKRVALCEYPFSEEPREVAMDLTDRYRVAGSLPTLSVVTGWHRGRPNMKLLSDRVFDVMMTLAVERATTTKSSEIWVWAQADTPQLAKMSIEACDRVQKWLRGS